VHVLAHRADFGHRRDDAVAEVVGMRAGEAHAAQTVHRAHRAQQVGEVVLAVVVAIDRLPK